MKIAIALVEYGDAHVDVLVRDGWSVGDDGFEREYPDGPGVRHDLQRLWGLLRRAGPFSGAARHVAVAGCSVDILIEPRS